MCGIVGFTGREQAAPILLDGLSKCPGAMYGQKGSGTVNKRLTNCEQIFEKSRMASNENS